MNQKLHIPNLPNLLEIQKSSFCWFLETGLAYQLNQFSSFGAVNDNLELKIAGHNYRLRKPEYTIWIAKKYKLTFSLKLYVEVELIVTKEKEEKIEKQQVLIGEIPLMTKKGSFIINGFERVV